MKIGCACGGVIPDNSDYLSYKAYLISDQDQYDLDDAIEQAVSCLVSDLRGAEGSTTSSEEAEGRALRAIEEAMFRYTSKRVYQCPACARLYIVARGDRLHAFVPAEPTGSGKVLGSVEGDKWRRPLRGHWRSTNGADQRDGKGELWWGFEESDQGSEEYNRWEELRGRYFEVLTRLQERGILRDAFLSKDGETIHVWPPEQTPG